MKSTYTAEQANATLVATREAFNPNDINSVVNHHMALLYAYEADRAAEVAEIEEEYGIKFDEVLPNVTSYRWNMEEAIKNRQTGETYASASIKVVEYVQELLDTAFYAFEQKKLT